MGYFTTFLNFLYISQQWVHDIINQLIVLDQSNNVAQYNIVIVELCSKISQINNVI